MMSGLNVNRRLNVNIDHIAAICQSRPTNEPGPAAVICELAGAGGITTHFHNDRR